MAVYEDLAQQYQQMIQSGKLKPGDKLPTNDELAEGHDVSVSTIGRVVKLLKVDGWVHTTHSGTFVGARPADPRLVQSKLERINCGNRPRCKNFIELDRNLELASALPATGWSTRKTPQGVEYYCHQCTPPEKNDN